MTKVGPFSLTWNTNVRLVQNRFPTTKLLSDWDVRKIVQLDVRTQPPLINRRTSQLFHQKSRLLENIVAYHVFSLWKGQKSSRFSQNAQSSICILGKMLDWKAVDWDYIIFMDLKNQSRCIWWPELILEIFQIVKRIIRCNKWRGASLMVWAAFY